MAYSNVPNYGKRVRPRPLTVIYPADSQKLRQPVQRRAASYTPRQTMPVFRPTDRRPLVMPKQAEIKAKNRRSFKLPLAATFAVALIVFTLFRGYGDSHNVAQAINVTAPIKSVKNLVNPTDTVNASASAGKQARMKTYSDTVKNIISLHTGQNIAVATTDLSDGSAMTLGDQGTFTAASTAKLITAVTLLHEVEQGRSSLNKTIGGQKAGALLQDMIINSDNDAWHTLNDYLTHGTLKSYMDQSGLTQYDPDLNTLLPSDMTLLMGKLYKNQLLNQTDTNLLLSYMRQANKQEYIVANVPSGYTVYHKAGWLDGLMHDVAIISDGNRTITLSIYTYSPTEPGDSSANQQLFKQITQAAMNAYFPAAAN
jgi:beta-lactamase class A